MLGLLAALFGAVVVAAQAQPAAPVGQLHITAMDPNGQPLNAVLVRAERGGTTVAEDRTTPSGYAFFARLVPGTYKIVLEKQGFYSLTVDQVVIAAGQTLP